MSRIWADPLQMMLPRVRVLPGGAVAGLFEAVPHPSASFCAGLAGGQVFYLTGAPAAFAGMMRASGVQVTDEQTATQVGCGYVETTRTFGAFTGVLGSVDDIRWVSWPGREPGPRVAARLRQLVRPPAATGAGPGRYEVSLFVLHGSAVERRVLTVATDGAVCEQAEQIVSGLPVPISLWPQPAGDAAGLSLC